MGKEEQTIFTPPPLSKRKSTWHAAALQAASQTDLSLPSDAPWAISTGGQVLMMSKAQSIFVLKIAPQRGEAEKREVVQILEQSTQNL